MAWNVPKTWAVSEVVTAAMLNAQLRDNMEDLDARTTVSEAFTGTTETTTSTNYTDLATVGPALTVVTGVKVMVTITARLRNTAATAFMSCAVSGASTISASDARCLRAYSASGSAAFQMSTTFEMNVTPGANTFTAKYKTSDAAAGAEFQNRRITVLNAGKLS